jgi:hypothetical protein
MIAQSGKPRARKVTENKHSKRDQRTEEEEEEEEEEERQPRLSCFRVLSNPPAMSDMRYAPTLSQISRMRL